MEKKKMWYADFEWPATEPKEAIVIIEENGDVVTFRYADGDDWYEPRRCDHFYKTKKKAEDTLASHRMELLSKMEEMKQYVESMNNWLEDVGEEVACFKQRDYLPNQNICDRVRDGYTYQMYIRYRDEKKRLVDIVQTDYMNIGGDTFKVCDVEHVCWGKEKAELTLRSGRKITTHDEVEKAVVEDIFGENRSGYTYTRLNDKDEDDDD